MGTPQLKAPFPYFGGKSRIAPLVWDRFGRIDNYVECFFGSGAVLLGCPHPGHTETVNDADGLLANFWRSLQHDPDSTASYADWPVNEADLHARHRWLVDRRSMVESLMADPDWYDVQAAGWWVWGISQWIGTGWCPPTGAAPRQAPHLSAGAGGPDKGTGVHRLSLQAPMLHGDSGASGRGVHAKRLQRGVTKDGALWKTRPHLASTGSKGNGVHRGSLSRQMPEVGAAAGGTFDGRGVHRKSLSQRMPAVGAYFGSETHPGMDNARGEHRAHHDGMPLYDYFRALSARLRRVRVVCGDFARILGPSVTWRHGTTAVFLDPPYADAEHAVEYAGGGAVWERVTRWCEENGGNALLRIALCGYEGTWQAPGGWEAIKWRTPGGYGSQGQGRGRENAAREVVWFSPHCDNETPLERLIREADL